MGAKQKRWSSPTTAPVAETCSQGAIFCLLVLVITVVISGLQYWQIFKDDDRLFRTFIICIVASALPGIIGLVAHMTRNSPLLGLHIALTLMCGAALVITYYQTHATLDQNCHLNQDSFAGCDGCTCAASNACERKDFKDSSGCKSCDAWPTDLCSMFLDNNIDFASITKYLGVVMLFLMAVPPIFSLIAFVRIQSRNMSILHDLEIARDQVNTKLEILEEGNKDAVDTDELTELTEFLKCNGKESDCALVMRVRKLLGWDDPDLEAGSVSKEKSQGDDESVHNSSSSKTKGKKGKGEAKKSKNRVWAWGRKDSAEDKLEQDSAETEAILDGNGEAEAGDESDEGSDDIESNKKSKHKQKKEKSQRKSESHEVEEELPRRSRKSSEEPDKRLVPKGRKSSEDHGHDKHRKSKRSSVKTESTEVAPVEDKKHGRRGSRKSSSQDMPQVLHSSDEEEPHKPERSGRKKK